MNTKITTRSKLIKGLIFSASILDAKIKKAQKSSTDRDNIPAWRAEKENLESEVTRHQLAREICGDAVKLAR